MSEKDRQDPEKETLADLEEARQARALAEALEGKDDPARPLDDLLSAAASVAAGREPGLDPAAQERIAAELFGAQRRQAPARWPLAAAAALLVAVSSTVVVLEHGSADRARAAERAHTHQAAEALVAALLGGQGPADRAEAIARDAEGMP